MLNWVPPKSIQIMCNKGINKPGYTYTWKLLMVITLPVKIMEYLESTMGTLVFDILSLLEMAWHQSQTSMETLIQI